MCEGLCGEQHQEDPPMDDVAQFRGAHVHKGSDICCCIHFDEHASHLRIYAYMHVYIIHGELSIFLDIKVCGFSMYIQYGDCELVYICPMSI